VDTVAASEESRWRTVSFADPTWLAQERQSLDAHRRGDRRALDRLFEAYAEALYRRVLLPRLGDPTAAEDALAETFRKALQRLDGYEDRGRGLWPYLATIAANEAIDVFRERARRRRALVRFEALLAPLADEQTPPGPDEEPDRARVRAAVDEVLGAINPRYRRAIELRFLQERSREDCAAAMEVKLGTFDVLLLRALRAFRQAWELRGSAAQNREAT
jgi:RNA polymerase sigma factor (sigma-70 family)